MLLALTSQKKLLIASLSLAVITLPFSIPLCHIALILFLIISLTQQAGFLSHKSFRDNLLVILFAALLITHLVGMLYTENIAYGLTQLEKKIFLFFVPLLLAGSVRFERNEVVFIFCVFITSCVIASLVCLINSFYQIKLLMDGSIILSDFNYLGTTPYEQINPNTSVNWMLVSYRSLASGIAMHPTYLSLYLVFCIIILFDFFDSRLLQTSKQRSLAIGLIIYFSVFVVFLSSRIIIIGLIALFFVTFLRSPLIRNTWQKLGYTFFVIVGIILLTYTNPITRYRCYQELSVTSLNIKPNHIYKNSTEIRASLWWLGLKSIPNINWIWGSGTGDALDTMKRTSDAYNVKNIIDAANPQNQFLCTVLQHGIMGMFVLMALLAIPMRIAWAGQQYFVLTFCSLFILTCFTEPVLELQKGIDFFAIFYPLILFHYCPHKLNSNKNKTSYGRERTSSTKCYQDTAVL